MKKEPVFHPGEKPPEKPMERPITEMVSRFLMDDVTGTDTSGKEISLSAHEDKEQIEGLHYARFNPNGEFKALVTNPAAFPMLIKGRIYLITIALQSLEVTTEPLTEASDTVTKSSS